MEERALGLLALVAALGGLALLAGVSQLALAAPADFDGLAIADVGRAVRACGTVAAARERNGNFFLALQSNGRSLPAVVFRAEASLPAIGSSLCMTATVSEYPANSGEIELVYRKGEFTVAPEED